jgi:hypothetical protein
MCFRRTNDDEDLRKKSGLQGSEGFTWLDQANRQQSCVHDPEWHSCETAPLVYQQFGTEIDSTVRLRPSHSLLRYHRACSIPRPSALCNRKRPKAEPRRRFVRVVIPDMCTQISELAVAGTCTCYERGTQETVLKFHTTRVRMVSSGDRCQLIVVSRQHQKMQ